MIKYILVPFLALFLSSCATPTPDTPTTALSSNQKAFDQEDMYILFALRAEEIGDYRSASELFNTLYENSAKVEYMHRSIRNDLTYKNFDTAIKKADILTLKNEDDILATRFKIVSLIGIYKYEEAKDVAVALVKKSQDVNDYILVSDIYVQLKDYESAVKYLESAYVKDYNEKILDKMSIVLYVNLHREKDAIAQLETHSRIHGCSKLICSRLVGFYSNDNNIEGLLSTYLRLYEIDKNPELSDKIVQVYAYKKDYPAMMTFLENSKSDDETLLQLYSSSNSYKNAQILAQTLYEKTGDFSYLGQSAIYEYEAHENKSDKVMLDAVVSKLKDVVSSYESPLYMNYLGYIMIDHEIDLDEGMKYVRAALKVEPNSAFYLDSLAWGYYKMNRCREAKEVMDRVVTLEGGDDVEVISHVKSIEKCLNK